MARHPVTAGTGQVRRAVWFAAALLLFAAAIAAHAAQAAGYPQWYWQQTDESLYRAAGAAIRAHPGLLYALRLGAPRLPFTYPPFAALLFAVASPLPFWCWQIALAASSILALPFIACLSLKIAGQPSGRGRIAAALALAAVGLWLEPVQKTLLFGQLNLLLLALILADLGAPRTRLHGAGVGIAAGIKLTPLIFVPYLLMTRRRAAAQTAVLTFLATAACGFLFLPGASASYWSGGFARPGDGPQRLVNQSINGFAQRLLHGGSGATGLWLGLAALTCAAGLPAAALASRRGQELLGILVCAVTGLLISPVSWTHHWVWVLPGVALATARTCQRRGKAGLLAAAAVVGLFGMWPARSGPNGYYDPRAAFVPRGLLRFAPHNFSLEYHWRGLELILGNYYVLAGAIFVTAAAGYLAATHGHGAQPGSPVKPVPSSVDSERAKQPVIPTGDIRTGNK